MERCNGNFSSDLKYKYNLPDEWKKKAEEEVNENPETVEEDVATFRKKVKSVPGLTSRLDDCFLLSFLRANWFDQEVALASVQKFYEFRRTYPEYFEPILISENKQFYDRKTHTVLIEKDSLGRTIGIARLGKYNFTAFTVEQMWRAVFTCLDMLLFDQTFQVGGFVVIMDCREVELVHLKQVTYKFIKIFSQLLLDTYPVHFKAFHVLYAPFYFHIARKLVSPFLSKEMLGKFFIHSSEMTDYDADISWHELPIDYGGTQPGFDNEGFLNRLLDMQDALKEHASKYGYLRRIDST